MLIYFFCDKILPYNFPKFQHKQLNNVNKIFFTTFLFIITLQSSIFAHAEQFPEWFSLNAYFSNPPKFNEKLEVLAEFSALNIEISSITLKILFPQSWKEISSTTVFIQKVPRNKTEKIKFEIIPLSYINIGSVVVTAFITTPKKELLNFIKNDSSYQNDFEIYKNTIDKMPTIIQTACDIGFSLTEYESFYPLSDDMWSIYDNRIKIHSQFLGPVLYKDDLLSPYQAQTDVEMYEKLLSHIKSNPSLEQTLVNNGIDIRKKKADFINALYVLAQDAYLKGNYTESINLIKRIKEEIKDSEKTNFKLILLRSGNLLALNYWSLGNKRMAEETFRNTFYIDKKAPVQRYILRNMGLLMLENGDIKTAREMFRLALEFKPEFFLLQSEFNKIKPQ